MVSHWYPRLNRRGQVARGHNVVSVDGVELGEGIAPQWYFDDTLLVRRFDDRLYPMDPVTGVVGDPVAGPIGMGFAAGGGTWALTGGEIIHVAVSREGEQAWIEEAFGNNADRAVFVEGVQLLAHAPINWCRLEGDAVVWSDQASGRVWGCGCRIAVTLGAGTTWGEVEGGGGAPECLQLAHTPELRGVPIPTPEGLWILTMTHTELRLAPWGSTLGYLLALGDNQNLDPDAIYLDGRIRVVWYDGVTTGPGQIDLDLSAPRVDLLAVAPPEPEPPEPEPPEPEPPEPEPPTPEPEPPQPEPLPPEPIEVPTMKVALSTPAYINWRWGGGQSFDPPTNPDDPNREPFEFGRPAAGVDEWCELVEHGAYYAVRSPNGRSWLSVQLDGSLEERDAAGAPGEWELFTLDTGVLIEKAKEGVTRPPQEFIL